MKNILILLILCFGVAGIAKADTDGNSLYKNLKSKDAADNLIAYAYIDAVLDTQEIFKLTELNNIKPNNSNFRFKFKFICFGGQKITFGQIKDIVYRYLETHPEIRHYLGAVLVRNALMEDFSCAANPD